VDGSRNRQNLEEVEEVGGRRLDRTLAERLHEPSRPQLPVDGVKHHERRSLAP
jgi:hypothetical protein